MRRVGIILCLCWAVMVNAQHSFEAGLRGGLADWNAKTYYVAPQPNLHAGIELAYAYRSPQVVGFRTGITVDLHKAAFGKHNYEDSYQTIDVDNQRMQVDYTIGNLTETYSIWAVGIPVQLSFSWDNVRLAAGPKFVFPLSARWYESAENAALSVYYPDYDNRVYDSYPLAASRDFSMTEQGALTVPKIQYWLASELTYAIPLSPLTLHHTPYTIHHTPSLTIGVYFDYSFSGLAIEHNDAPSLITLTDTREGFPLQRILSPVLTSSKSPITNYQSPITNPLVSHCALFDVGIKIAYTISPYNPFSRSSRKCHCH